MAAYSGKAAGSDVHCGNVVPQAGPSLGSALGRGVAVASTSRRHSAVVRRPSLSGPLRAGARPPAATRPPWVPVRGSRRSRRASTSSRTAPPAVYGDAADVPPPVVGVLAVVLSNTAP